MSVDSCPVNCIYWVDREELPVLEFLIQPQFKEGYGVFGGGWERPKNVFGAAESFSKQLKHQTASEYQQRNSNIFPPSCHLKRNGLQQPILNATIIEYT